MPKLLTLFSGTFLVAAIFLSHVPSAAIGSLTDDDMFEFARSELDRTSTTVRKHLRARARPGARPKVTSTGLNNYYLSAQKQVGKAMAIANGMRRTTNDKIIKETALLAFRNNRIPEALSAMGVGIYNDYQRHIDCKKRPSRCKRPTGIVEQLRAVLGNDKFNDFMSIDGDVTLVFVIDTTYSMSEEIIAAKNIIENIASYKREGQVDYILSQFNDPLTGPVHGKLDSRDKFLEKVRNLTVYGGGDCKEKTFHGIIDAIEKGKPRIGSPMYVFTDAGPKDENWDDQYNIDNAIGLAYEDYNMPINFFFSNSPGSCENSQTFESFKTLIEETNGIGVVFGSESKISLMGEVVKASLDGMTTIKSGGSSSGRRVSLTLGRKSSGVAKRYSIPVDDTVNKLIIVLTVESSPSLVQLRDPRNIVVAQTYQLAQGAIWVINSPRRGSWSLEVPNTVRRHSFKVTSSSLVNIDFDHYFVWTLPGNRHVEFPIAHPLQNEVATVKLLIPLKNKLNMNSLILEIVKAEDGSLISQTSLSGITAKFTPPPTAFKLRLKGRTASGFLIERTARKVIQAQPTLIRPLYNRNYILVYKGRSSYVRFAFHNVGPSDKFKLSLTTSLSGVTIKNPRRYTRRVLSGKKQYFSAKITPSRHLSEGQIVPVLITATHVSSGKKASQLRVKFLVKN